MDHSKSSTVGVPPKVLARGASETRQSYMLLAVGIVVALTLPYLLRPRAAAFSAAPVTAMGSHSPVTSSP